MPSKIRPKPKALPRWRNELATAFMAFQITSSGTSIRKKSPAMRSKANSANSFETGHPSSSFLTIGLASSSHIPRQARGELQQSTITFQESLLISLMRCPLVFHRHLHAHFAPPFFLSYIRLPFTSEFRLKCTLSLLAVMSLKKEMACLEGLSSRAVPGPLLRFDCLFDLNLWLSYGTWESVLASWACEHRHGLAHHAPC